METINDTLDVMNGAMPETFDFYHLGKVEARPAEAEDFLDLEDSVFMGFRFQGDLNGILIAVFDRGLDLSTYTELGNIIASRFATRLSDASSIDVMISPPQTLGEPLFRKLTSAAPSLLSRTYRHLDGKLSVPIQVLLLPAVAQEAGLA